jgi:hypothetical protein
VTVTATDSHGKATTEQFAWSIRDTATTMPNYIDNCGCGQGGLPDVSNLSNHAFSCANDPNSTSDLIYRQSIAPGTVISWGQSIGFWYGYTPNNGCQDVAKGW